MMNIKRQVKRSLATSLARHVRVMGHPRLLSLVENTQYDGRIVKMAVGAMPWMLVCHCLFALFAFSGTGVFGSDFLADLVESGQVEVSVR